MFYILYLVGKCALLLAVVGCTIDPDLSFTKEASAALLRAFRYMVLEFNYLNQTNRITCLKGKKVAKSAKESAESLLKTGLTGT